MNRRPFLAIAIVIALVTFGMRLLTSPSEWTEVVAWMLGCIFGVVWAAGIFLPVKRNKQ